MKKSTVQQSESPIPPILLENLRSCMLGRVKLLLLQEISGSVKQLPTSGQLRKFFFSKLRSNPTWGMILHAIYALNNYVPINYNDIDKEMDVTKIINDLRDYPIRDEYFVEMCNSPAPFPKNMGLLIRKENLLRGGDVYNVIFIAEERFPQYTCGYADIGVSDDDSKVLFSTINNSSSSKFNNFQFDNYDQSIYVKLALQVLSYLLSDSKGQYIDDCDIETNEELKPTKENPKLISLLNQVVSGKLQLTRMRVPFSMVKPYDMQFCLRFPLGYIESYIKDAEDGLFYDIVVYWEDGCFIMDDDYPIYLAYRSLELEEVNVVHLGSPPPGIGIITKVGGKELLPPVGVLGHNTLALPVSEEELLDKRLKKLPESSTKPTSDSHTNFLAAFVGLARLIQKKDTKEREIHNFLVEHPYALDAYGSSMMSEVCLGKDYRIDLVLQYGFSDKHVMLVELERANWPIFNKAGHLRAEVTHAIGQVEDWIMWWQEHPSEVPAPLDAKLPVEGLVVIGRSSKLTDKQKRRLVHLNNNRKVKVITYDDLLDRIEKLHHHF